LTLYRFCLLASIGVVLYLIKMESDSESISLDMPEGGGSKFGGIKMILAMFVIILFVLNNTFTKLVLSKIGKTTDGRNITGLGNVIRAVFIIVMVIIVKYLFEGGII
jgi:hypothetical protein